MSSFSKVFFSLFLVSSHAFHPESIVYTFDSIQLQSHVKAPSIQKYHLRNCKLEVCCLINSEFIYCFKNKNSILRMQSLTNFFEQYNFSYNKITSNSFYFVWILSNEARLSSSKPTNYGYQPSTFVFFLHFREYWLWVSKIFPMSFWWIMNSLGTLMNVKKITCSSIVFFFTKIQPSDFFMQFKIFSGKFNITKTKKCIPGLNYSSDFWQFSKSDALYNLSQIWYLVFSTLLIRLFYQFYLEKLHLSRKVVHWERSLLNLDTSSIAS